MLRPVLHVDMAEQLANEAQVLLTLTPDSPQVDCERAEALVRLAEFHRDMADMMLSHDVPFHGAQPPDDGQP